MWSAINSQNWKDVPCIRSRPAVEADVKLGCSVFYVKPSSEHEGGVYEMALPQLAIFHDSENKNDVCGIIIQAEEVDGNVAIGFRPFEGGNLLATLEEFSLVNSLEELNFFGK